MENLKVESMKRGRGGSEDLVKKTNSVNVKKIREPTPTRSRSTSRIIPKEGTSVKKQEGTSITMVIFLIISIVALYFVMMPSRKF